jgi:3-phosphoshikimate 1-carboxyvinyltransferase
MRLTITPGSPLRGTVDLPGDKSLSHRAALFAAMAEGQSRIENFLVSGVTRAMLNALSALGIVWRLEGADTLIVESRGLAGWCSPAQPIDCGNSATTIRLLAGAIAAAGVDAVLTGSEGLRRRPMGRITQPLRRMGVEIEAAPGEMAPLHILGRAGHKLRGLNETLPVASAQVKSCLLLAALAAEGETVLYEPGPSRDHTERMLQGMGITVSNRVLEGTGGPAVYETRLSAPGWRR